MRTRTRAACLSAAVAAVSFGFNARAEDLIWDVNPGVAGPQDGTGSWDTSQTTWLNSGGTNVAWDNVGPDNAVFGGGTGGPGFIYNVEVVAPVTVQNIILREVGGDAQYGISTFGAGSINLLGNIIKEGNDGSLNYFADTVLTTNHVITLRDTPTDVPELIFNGTVSGAGGLTVDNGTFEAWGTLSINQTNTYTGVTNINKGRIVLTTPDGLGGTGASSGTVISNQGTLSLFGAQTLAGSGMTINEPIRITRSQYAEAGGEFARYDGAISSNGDPSGVPAISNTIAGPVVFDTTDARIQVNGAQNSLTISSNITQVGTAKLSKSGGGVLFLTGNNTYGGGTQFRGGTVAPSNNNAIGGANSTFDFQGGLLRPFAGMTNFGTHPTNFVGFSGGLDVPAGQSFVVDQPLTNGGVFIRRGTGAFNFAPASANTFTGNIRFEGGSTTIAADQSLATTGSPFAIGPAIGGIPGVSATLINNGGTINSNGEFWVGNGNGATGVYTQTAGATTVNNWIPIGRDTSTGTLNLNGGTLTKTGGGNVEIDFGGGGRGIAHVTGTALFDIQGGEVWVGQAGGSNGELNVGDSGTVRANSWFAVGRGGGTGTLNLSESGRVERNGNNGNHFIVADGGGSVGTVNVTENSQLALNMGELWVGQSGNSNGTLNIQDSGAVTVNNWVAIGRAGGTGVTNFSGGTFTKTGGGNFIVGAGGGTNGTLNQTGGALSVTSDTWIAEGATTGTWNMSGGTAALARLDIGRNGGGTGVLNLSGTAAITAGIVRFGEAGTVVGTLNLNGGSIQATQVVDGNSSGASTLNFNGGTLKAGANSDTWFQGLTAANVKAGGAKFDSNGFEVRANQNLVHDPALGAIIDGGLAKTGAGAVVLGGTNTYTGTTTVNGGVLGFATRAALYNATPASWTDTNIVVNSGATLALHVGGGPETFTAADVDAIKSLGTATGGFRNGASLGFDTSPGNFTYGSTIGNTNGGANALGVVKRGANTLTLTAANTYTGGTTVQAGTLQVNRMHENNPVNITAGKLQVLDSGPTLPSHPSGDNAFVSRPSALTIANNGAPLGTRTYAGQLDLGNNDLILDYSGASPLDDIQDMIRAGYNGGDWLGNGITSSTANANRNFAIGVADNANLAIPFDATRPFSGQTVDTTTILVKFTHRIDLDMDGVITTNDATIFNSRYSEGAPAYWSIGDLDYDRVFTTNDATLFNSFYNEALASVPEPAALGLLGMGAVGLLGCRRRRSTCAAPARVGILS